MLSGKVSKSLGRKSCLGKSGQLWGGLAQNMCRQFPKMFDNHGYSNYTRACRNGDKIPTHREYAVTALRHISWYLWSASFVWRKLKVNKRHPILWLSLVLAVSPLSDPTTYKLYLTQLRPSSYFKGGEIIRVNFLISLQRVKLIQITSHWIIQSHQISEHLHQTRKALEKEQDKIHKKEKIHKNGSTEQMNRFPQSGVISWYPTPRIALFVRNKISTAS